MNKKFILHLLFTFLLIICSAKSAIAQSTDPGIDALINRNQAYLFNNMSRAINLTIDQSTQSLDKEEALKSVFSFFSEKGFSRYSIRHRGNSDDGSLRYIIANVYSSQGRYRLFVHYSNRTKEMKEIRLVES